MNAIFLMNECRLRAFSGAGGEHRARRAGMWLRAILGNQKAVEFCSVLKSLRVTRAESEGLNTAGGVLVPEEVATEIASYRDLVGVFRQEAEVRPMGSDRRSVPRRTGGASGYFLQEGVAVTESTATWDEVGLSAEKIGALVRLSSELDEDSAPDLGRFFVEELGSALAEREDAAAFSGDGTSTYANIQGVLAKLADAGHAGGGRVAATSGHDLYTELDANDLGSLVGALPERYLGSAKFYASSFAVANTFLRLGATTGGFTVTRDGIRPVLFFAGYPIIVTGKMPGSGSQLNKIMILFGDMRQAAMLGNRRGLTIARSTEFKFAEDQVALKGIERVAINIHNLGDATKAGALVGLMGG